MNRQNHEFNTGFFLAAAAVYWLRLGSVDGFTALTPHGQPLWCLFLTAGLVYHGIAGAIK